MKKFNIIDLLALGIVMLFGSLVALIAVQPERNLGTDTILEVRVPNPSNALTTEMEKKGTVYLNGVDVPATIIRVTPENGAALLLIEGKGTEKGELMTFNGQRILINQKVELHGSFWAQGTIIGFEIK